MATHSKYITSTKEKIRPEGASRSRAVKPGDFILSNSMSFGRPYIMATDGCIHDGWLLLRTRSDNLLKDYLYLALGADKVYEQFVRSATGGVVNNLNIGLVKEVLIPLPPLEVQHQIVAEVEGYQKVIDGARQVLDNYKPHIVVNPDWPVLELGDLCKPEYGYTAAASDAGSHRFVRITDIDADGKLKSTDAKYIDASPDAVRSLLAKGDILVARTGATFGKTMLFNEDYPAIYASYLIRLSLPNEKVIPGYYWAFAQSTNYWNQANALMTGGGQPQFNGNALVKISVPVPDLATQRAIVAEIEAEQALVNTNRELIRRMEAKVKAAIDRVWGLGR